MEGETREFRVVPIDGVLVDVRRTFIELGSSLLRRPLQYVVKPEPPHTLACLSYAAGLDETESQRVRRLIEIIEDFWTTLPPIEGAARSWGPGLPPIFYVKRVQTRGRSVLLQTVSWLEKQGFRDPIVWCEEE